MPQPSTGARSATGRRRKPLGWLPWVLLLVLALIVAVVILIVVRVKDDDDDTAAVTTPTVAADVATPAVSA
jgi:hypothetical protein